MFCFFFLIWFWILVNRTDVFHRTQAYCLTLNLKCWFLNQDHRAGVWRCKALWHAALKPVRFSDSCQIAHFWNTWPFAQNLLSVDNARWSPGTHRLKPNAIPFYTQKGDSSLFHFIIIIIKKKVSHLLTWKKAFFLKCHFHFVSQFSNL